MIVCTNCGNHNENDDEFCGSCGKFLEWVGERVEAPVAAVVEVEAEPEAAARVGLVDRVKAAVGIDDHPNGEEAPAIEEVPTGPTDEEVAAAAAAAAEQSRLEGEAAEAARRAAQAEVEARQRAEDQRKADAAAEAARRAGDEAKAKAAEEAAAARRAEEEARRRVEDEARATAEAERRREAEAEASRRAEEESAAVAAAEAQVAAAQESARRAQAAADREALDAAAQEAAEAEASRQVAEAQQAADALAAARRAEEAARAQAESQARARADAEAKEREEIEARRRAEDEARHRGEEEAKAKAEAEARSREQEEARLRAEDETRARIAAEARAKEEEEARRRAAALLARPKAVAPPVAAETPPPAAAVFTPSASAAMTPTAAAQRPVAQQPTAVKAPPRPEPKAKPQERVLNVGDLVCDQCNEGNDPTRKFCRKCGNSLAKSVPAKKLPWWKTLFSGKKGGKVSKEAKGGKGSRAKANEAKYKTQRLMAKVRFIFMAIALLSLVGVNVAMPNLRGEVFKKVKGGFTSVQSSINPKFKTVNAVAVTATSAVPGHEPDFANDLVLNSFWAEAAEGDGVGQTISFTFEAASDLTKVLITAGSTDSPENYLNQPRPKELHLVFDNGGSADVTLEDEFRKSQSFSLKGAAGVTKVDVVVSSVYKGRAGLDTAIAEIEFKKKG